MALQERATKDRPESAHRGDLLIVDDTPENIIMLSSVLKEMRYRVRAVPSGALALLAVESEAPELILLDVSMPGMDGYEVCRRLKAEERSKDIPVIFLSALSDASDKVKAFSAGGVDYVTKPFRVEEISARVETHLSIRRLQAKLQRSNDELQRSYLRLQELERLRQALVQMIIHDLKNPIAAIQLNAGAIRSDDELKPELRVAIDDIFSSSRSMSRMVVDVLDVARTEEAALKPRLAPTALRHVLDEVARDVKVLGRASGKILALEVAADLPEEVVCDRELVRRIVENVIDNSFKYAPKQSEVKLEAARHDEVRYAIRVRDEGPGVPVAFRERVFEPYARLERDLEAHARMSRGLGLAFCRMAAEAHRGRIWIEDNVPRGTTFVICLPVDPTKATASPEAGAARRADAAQPATPLDAVPRV